MGKFVMLSGLLAPSLSQSAFPDFQANPVHLPAPNGVLTRMIYRAWEADVG
jgi:hypothetical protein